MGHDRRYTPVRARLREHLKGLPYDVALYMGDGGMVEDPSRRWFFPSPIGEGAGGEVKRR